MVGGASPHTPTAQATETSLLPARPCVPTGFRLTRQRNSSLFTLPYSRNLSLAVDDSPARLNRAPSLPVSKLSLFLLRVQIRLVGRPRSPPRGKPRRRG